MSELEPSPIFIKLHANQRLYDGADGCYRSVDDLLAWQALEVPSLIVDSSTGENVTDRILSQARH